jgi:hypothetical protein
MNDSSVNLHPKEKEGKTPVWLSEPNLDALSERTVTVAKYLL